MNVKYPFIYKGAKTKEISFPLGGIGTGSVGLGGDGRLIDWEIFNRPAKGAFNGYTHFAVRAEKQGKVLDARILNGKLQPPYIGPMGPHSYASFFGAGPARQTLAGMPHFAKSEFKGPFPIAEIKFEDVHFPGLANLTAFNPFIPLDDKNSSIPAAFFEVEITNTTDAPLDYTIAGTLCNPQPGNNVNRAFSFRRGKGVFLSSDSLPADSVKYGDMSLACAAEDTSVQEYWYRGGWHDNLEVFWRDFENGGRLKTRRYSIQSAKEGNNATVAAYLSLAPGESKSIRFILSWNFPNCENYWSEDIQKRVAEDGVSPTWKNYYASLWRDSAESAKYGMANWDELYTRTLQFRDALMSSTLPKDALDAVSANLSILKSPTVLRLADGTFYGWEGLHPTIGSCEGSCTHVWNYAMALPFLFPKLERSMREADYRYNLREDGGMPFRLQLPLGSRISSFRPCADGQLGGVIKTYRDWKICGDDEWLKRLWPSVKASLEFAWSPANEDKWDPKKSGVLWGRQHHTLDMELFGPNSWLTGIYLAALKAGAKMAEAVGGADMQAECEQIFAKGKRWLESNLFNGDYYFQKIDVADKRLLKPFAKDEAVYEKYWNDEAKQIKYQIGQGCEVDQTLGQWFADVAGLGDVFDLKRNKKALRAIFDNNFKAPISQIANPWRLYSLGDEAGLIICSWPKGKRKPVVPLTYSTETMNGFEYAAAVQMIANDMVEEGMTIVSAIRERYDGERRNPWNEFECGSNYARSMASYSLLQAFSGFEFDMTKKTLSFNPVFSTSTKGFQCFWSLDCAWGTFSIAEVRRGMEIKLKVLFGKLPLERLAVAFNGKADKLTARISGEEIPCKTSASKGKIFVNLKESVFDVDDELCIEIETKSKVASCLRNEKGQA